VTRKAKGKHNLGIKTVIKKNRTNRPAPVRKGIASWFTRFVKYSADYIPHLGIIHLNCRHRMDLYNQYIRHQRGMELEDRSSFANFYKVIAVAMGKTIKIPKIKLFSRCSTCDDLDDKIKNTRAVELIKIYELQKQVHMTWQMDERLKYYHHIAKSRANPLRWMSIILDGMDQSKTSLLRLKRDTSASANLNPLKMAVITALCYSHKPYSQTFTFPNDFPKDILVRALKAIQEISGLPDILYLQLDNTTRENKNTTVFVFLSLLVHLNIFTKVHVMMIDHAIHHVYTTYPFSEHVCQCH
jgi:hypothetical protein